MNDADLIEVVKEDLVYLETIYNGSPEDVDIKRTSVTLRRLLIEGNFNKVWRILGFEGKVLITTLRCPVHSVGNSPDISMKGGANTEGLRIANVLIYNRALTDADIKELSSDVPVPESMSLGKYLNEICVCISNVNISVEDLIKYFANRLGGVHIDMTVPQEEKYGYLDVYRKKYKLSKNESLHYQLLSIGQEFINSPDIQKLLNYVRNKA